MSKVVKILWACVIFLFVHNCSENNSRDLLDFFEINNIESEFCFDEIIENVEEYGDKNSDYDFEIEATGETDELEDAQYEDFEEENGSDAYPPYLWGPYYIGVRTIRAYNPALSKQMEIKVWYPAVPPSPDSSPVTYMYLLEGRAYENLDVSLAFEPFPVILFSHGNKGINFQSYSFTEFLASHGFFVVAPNHPGNTLFDNPSDEDMAGIALERPVDIAFSLDVIISANRNPADPFYGKVDEWNIGVSGHSFGGYTTILLSGATIDVDAAKQRCIEGTGSDIFCPYIGYWPAGSIISRPPQMWVVKASVALAPGGYAAFGDEGLNMINIPVMIFGGTLDEWTPLEYEIRPIYDGISSDAWKIELERGGHMSFTDICRIPGSILIPDLADMCDQSVYINIDRAFEIVDTFATAFFRFYLKGENAMQEYLTSEFAASFPDISFSSK